MDINTLAAWGEFIGGIAVVVTLIYLVGQVRTGNRLVRAESLRNTEQAIIQFGLAIAQDRELVEIWATGLGDPHALDGSDRTRFTWLMGCLVAPTLTAHNDHRLGLVPTNDLTDLKEGYRATLDSPGGRWWWEKRKAAYHSDFVEFIDNEIFSD